MKSKSLQCLFCCNIYRHPSTLECHTNRHTGEHPYECKYCGETFTDFSYLRRHRNLAHLRKRYHCKLCRASYADNQTLKGHMDKVHSGKKYICGGCRTQYSSHFTLKIHRNGGRCNGVRKLKCPGKVSSIQDKRLKGVYKMVEKEAVPKINRKSKSSVALRKSNAIHGRTTTTPSKRKSCRAPSNHLTYECLFCSKDILGYRGLEAHINQHSGEHPYECTKCPANFTDRRYLALHIDKVHNGKVYVCRGCHKEYSSPGVLTRHRNGGYCTGNGVKEVLHSSKVIRKFPVGKIKKVVRTSGNAIRNFESSQEDNSTGKVDKAKKTVNKLSGQGKMKRIRETEKIKIEVKSDLCNRRSETKLERNIDRKPVVSMKSAFYKCTQCPTTYPDRNLLLKHAADCHGRKIFECPICQNLYTDPCNMKRHMKTSHPNDRNCEILKKRDTNCADCNLKFDSYFLLLEHKKTKHNLKVFKCPYCPNEYTDRSNMMRHQKSHSSVDGVMKKAVRFPKVYETVQNKKKQVPVTGSSKTTKEEEEEDITVAKYPVILDLAKSGISDKSSQEAYQQLVEIVNQVMIQKEQRLEQNLSFFLHLNRYDPLSV